MTWNWSYSYDVSMKNVLKFVWILFGLFTCNDWFYIQMSIWQPCVQYVGPCHNGMVRPQVADGGTASNM
jgi:hypothetical protein